MPSFTSMLFRATYRTVAISFPTVVEGVVGGLDRGKCDTRLHRWADGLLKDVGVELEVRGRELIDLSGPTVVMSNHQSLYDIPVLFQVIPPSLRMVAKKELFRIPLWGNAMKAAGFISIDRQNRFKAMQSLAEARRTLESGVTVWIAPEGTRSLDGSLLPFKKGGFALAQEINAPILPITIDGTREILPAKTRKLNHGTKVIVTVHPKIHSTDAPPGIAEGALREWMMNRVRDAIASGLGTGGGLT